MCVDSNHKDKAIVEPSYLNNENSYADYTEKTTLSYWNAPTVLWYGI